MESVKIILLLSWASYDIQCWDSVVVQSAWFTTQGSSMLPVKGATIQLTFNSCWASSLWLLFLCLGKLKSWCLKLLTLVVLISRVFCTCWRVKHKANIGVDVSLMSGCVLPVWGAWGRRQHRDAVHLLPRYHRRRNHWHHGDHSAGPWHTVGPDHTHR